MDHDAVAAAITFAAAEEVLPRFRRLEAGDIEEKSPGDLVTVADRACEVLLTGLLRDVRDIPVIGEEAAAADPSIIGQLQSSPAVWVVDPIDGTSNFAAGSTDYGVMVALVEGGDTQAAWIWQPSNEMMATAVRGEGARIDGETITMREPASVARSTGILKTKYIAEPLRSTLTNNAAATGGLVSARGSAAIEYPNVVTGDLDFLFYWRTLPWDHVPGTLLVTEAGGTARRPDGAPFRAGDDALGLLVTHDALGSPLLEAFFTDC